MSVGALLQNSPDYLVLLSVLGILLIYVELNRPGLVLPGAIGLTLVLLCSSVILTMSWRWAGIALLGLAVVMQAFALRQRLPQWAALIAGISAYFGCRGLLAQAPGHVRISFPVALLTGLILGPGTSVLTEIARRARANKGLDF